MSDSDLHDELLAFHFGCHEDPDRMAERLRSSPELRQLLERVQAEAQILERAAAEPVPPLKLAREDVRARGLSNRFGPWRWAAAASLLALVVPAAGWMFSASALNHRTSETLAMVVTGPGATPDGAGARFRVQVKDGRGMPRGADLHWTTRDARGETVISGTVVARDGVASIELPPRLDAAQHLEIAVAEREDVRPVRVDLARSWGTQLIHLGSDKPVYRPGDMLKFRTVSLSDRDLAEEPSAVTWRLRDPRDQVVAQQTVYSQDSVANTSWPLPSDAPGGVWHLEVIEAQQGFAIESLPLTVLETEPPRLFQDLKLAQSSYPRGSTGEATLKVQRLGAPPGLETPVGALVNATLLVDGAEAWTGEARLDRDGQTSLRFPVPSDVNLGDARLVTRVTDGPRVESSMAPFVIPVGRLDVTFFPESGNLVANVSNRVYAEVRDPRGRPAHATGRIEDPETGEIVSRFETLHEGRGMVEITPPPDRSLRLVFDDADLAPVDLGIPTTDGVVLRTQTLAVEADGRLGVDLHLPNDGPWIVGAFRRGALLTHDTVIGSGSQRVTLMVPPAAYGVLRVTVFDRDLHPVAERLTHRLPTRYLDITCEPSDAVVAPGETQTATVRVRNEAGEPVRAVLGVRVYDRGLDAIAAQPAVALADHVGFFADVDPADLEEVDAFLLGSDHRAQRTDLLLGTRGWRRFVWKETETAIATHGDQARRLARAEGRSSVPRVLDTTREANAAMGVWWDRVAWWKNLTKLALGAVAALGVIGLVARAARGGSLRPAWVPFTAAGLGAAAMLMLSTNTAAPDASFSATAERAAPVTPTAFPVPPNSGLPPASHFITSWGLSPGGGFDNYAGFLAGGGGGDARVVLGLDGAPLSGFTSVLSIIPTVDPGQDAGLRFYSASPPHGEPERQFAEKSPTSMAPRGAFAEGIYWNPRLTTDENGEAEIAFPVSERVATWVIHVDGHDGTRVGYGTAEFQSLLPLSADVAMPSELSVGDEITLPVFVRCGWPSLSDATVTVDAAVSGGFELLQGADRSVQLQDGQARSEVKVRVMPGSEAGVLEVQVRCGTFGDALKRTVPIVLRGFPQAWSVGGQVGPESTGAAAVAVTLPDTWVDGTLDAQLRMYPSAVAELAAGLEGMIQEPHGCFEQTSATNFPNVLALRLARQTLGDGEPAFAARARQHLAVGYARLTSFECEGGGFDWFGASPAHVALTAYGLLQFHAMAEVHPVDAALLERTRRWLLSKKTAEGRFAADGGSHSFGAAPEDVRDAYVTWALAATGTAPEDLSSALDRMAARSRVTTDAYELALNALALHAAHRSADAAEARRRLAQQREADGWLVGTRGITGTTGSGLRVETTALSILAWCDEADAAGFREEAVRWLVGQRRGNGTFGSTQATILALQALLRYTEIQTVGPAPTGRSVRVRVNGQDLDPVTIPADGLAVVLSDLTPAFRPGENSIELATSAGRPLPFTVGVTCRSRLPANGENPPLELSVLPEDRPVSAGGPCSFTVNLSNRSTEEVANPIAVIGLPAGVEVPIAVLEAAKKAGHFDHVEIRGRELHLYWRGLPAGGERIFALDGIARFAGTLEGPASRVWPYYDPDRTQWVEPFGLTVR